MSVPVITGMIASTAAVAAARRQQEEEEMAGYDKSELEGWEFKIVRSVLGRFSSRRTVEKVRREEAGAGWELVEKFDDHRLRFKRRVERRSGDHLAKIDPYRTSLGFGGSGAAAGVIFGLILLLGGVAAFLFLNY